MLPAATFLDANASSNLVYYEDEVEPQVLMPSVAYAHQDYTSRASSVSTNNGYQGSSPRKYSVGRRVSGYVHIMATVDRDVPITPPLFRRLPWQWHVAENNANLSLYSESIFPPFAHMNQSPLETTMTQQEFDGSMANPFYDYKAPSSESPLFKICMCPPG